MSTIPNTHDSVLVPIARHVMDLFVQAIAAYALGTYSVSAYMDDRYLMGFIASLASAYAFLTALETERTEALENIRRLQP